MTDEPRAAAAGASQQCAGLAARSASARAPSGPVHQDLTNDHRRQT